jgi:hypothetical protein
MSVSNTVPKLQQPSWTPMKPVTNTAWPVGLTAREVAKSKFRGPT